MRFLELHTDYFGPLEDLHFEMHSNVFVVLGHNEAGKSSFHGALETILYGFEASSREKHPVAQFRPGRDLELRATVQLDDDTILNVHRTLMSQGKLVVLDEEGEVKSKSSNNAPLPAMQSVPRDVFQAVYSLTANDTDMQKDDVRGHIKELLLGETGLRGARPISDVRKEVLEDMQALWRDSSRGNPRAKELGDALKQAKKRRSDGKKLDRELREAKHKLDLLIPEQGVDRKHLAQLRIRLAELSFQAEWSVYARKRASIDLIDQRLVDCPKEWRQGSLSRPSDLESKLEKLARQLVAPQERLKKAPASLSPQEQLCLDKEAQIESAFAQVADRKGHLLKITHASQEIADSSQAIGDALRRLGANQDASSLLADFNTHALRADSDRWDADLEQFDIDSQELQASNLWIVGALIGVVGVAALGFDFGPSWAGLIGALLGFGLAIGSFLRPTRAGAASGPKPSLPRDSEELLAGLGLKTEDARTPKALTHIAEQLEQAQHSQAELGRQQQVKHSEQLELKQLEERWLQLASSVGITGNDPSTLPNEMRAAYKAADQAQRHVAKDRAERESAQAQLATLEPMGEAAGQRLQVAQDLLGVAFPDIVDADQAFEAWVENGHKRISADSDLERLQASPHFQSSLDGQADEHESSDEIQAEIEALENSTDERSNQIGQLQQRLAADKTAHFARAEEQVNELEQQLRETRESRDQLALLDRILVRAEASFRAENAPPVLKRAGEYLRAISQDRYTSLSYPADDDGSVDESNLQVYSEKDGLRDVAKPLSRGTQEQIYLALRLGTLDYMDEGRETLPLVLDEALVHWDYARRASLYEVLDAVSKKRQVILFTCHRSFAQEAEDALNARLIELPSRYEPEPAAEEQ